MMARTCALLAALLLAACGETEADWPAPTPAVWEVTAPSGDVGWLFGTVHAMPDGAEWRTPALAQVQTQAGVLIAEIADPGSGDAALFARLARTPGQPPLASRIGPEWRGELAEALNRTGQDAANFADVETWAAALMLASDASGDPANGVDQALVVGAAAVRPLETRASQLGLFDRLPAEDQALLLENALAEAQAADPHRMVRAWLVGDMAALDTAAREGLLADASLRKTLLIARNAAWLGPITQAIERGERPLVAVGAVHMAGADGLPALLAARGYAVRRLQ